LNFALAVFFVASALHSVSFSLLTLPHRFVVFISYASMQRSRKGVGGEWKGRKREGRQGRKGRVSSRQRRAKAGKFKMFLKVLQIDCKNI